MCKNIILYNKYIQMSNNRITLISPTTNKSPNRKESASSVSSPLPKFFLTSSMSQREMFGEGYSMVLELHKQLSIMVDNIGSKVAEVIDRSESEFLIAYRNHMKKIRNQLEEMRHKLQIHQNQTSVQKVNVLEKQLRLFRQQSLKMYDKLQLKNKECEQITARLKEMKQQNSFLQDEVKKLMRVNKILESERNKLGAQNNISVDQSISNNTQDQFFTHSKTSIRPNSHNRIYSLRNDKPLIQTTKAKQGQINNLVRKIERLEVKCRQHNQSTTDIRQQNQLQNFFLECVESVRKDLYKKQNRIGPQRWDIIVFQEFKLLDKIRILNLFVNNDKVLRLIYNEVFCKDSMGQPRYFSRLQTRTSKRSNRATSTFLN